MICKSCGFKGVEEDFCPICGCKVNDSTNELEKLRKKKKELEELYKSTKDKNLKKQLTEIQKKIRLLKKGEKEGGDQMKREKLVVKSENQSEVESVVPSQKSIEFKKSASVTIATDKIYAIADMKDEEQILAELEGWSIKPVYCYQFNVGEQVINGITWVGARELAKEIGGILTDPRLPPQVLKETEDDIYVGVSYAVIKDGKLQTSFWGVGHSKKRRWVKVKKLGKAILKTDDKAFVSACSKAQRNAILACVSKDIQDKVIEKWKAAGKVEVIKEEEIEEEKTDIDYEE